MEGLNYKKLMEAKEKLEMGGVKECRMTVIDTPRNRELIKQFMEAQKKHDERN